METLKLLSYVLIVPVIILAALLFVSWTITAIAWISSFLPEKVRHKLQPLATIFGTIFFLIGFIASFYFLVFYYSYYSELYLWKNKDNGADLNSKEDSKASEDRRNEIKKVLMEEGIKLSDTGSRTYTDDFEVEMEILHAELESGLDGSNFGTVFRKQRMQKKICMPIFEEKKDQCAEIWKEELCESN
jgi:predicted membrane protein